MKKDFNSKTFEINSEKRVQIEVNDYVKIEILGHVESLSNKRDFWHKHPFWELIYICQGRGVHYCEEVVVKGDCESLFLIPPQAKHRFDNDITCNNENLYIGFSFNYGFMLDAISQDFDYTLENMPGNELLKMNLREVGGLLKKSENNVPLFNAGGTIEALAKIANYVSTFYKSKPDIKENANYNLVNKIKEYVKSNICRSINVQEFAQMLYLSPHYIGDTFKKNTGLSLKEYHNTLRMEYAFRLIKGTDLSISEISEKIGFESIHYFSRRFKEYYTVSPNSLRKS